MYRASFSQKNLAPKHSTKCLQSFRTLFSRYFLRISNVYIFCILDQFGKLFWWKIVDFKTICNFSTKTGPIRSSSSRAIKNMSSTVADWNESLCYFLWVTYFLDLQEAARLQREQTWTPSSALSPTPPPGSSSSRESSLDPSTIHTASASVLSTRSPRQIIIQRSEDGFGFTLRHFIVYPPEVIRLEQCLEIFAFDNFYFKL